MRILYFHFFLFLASLSWGQSLSSILPTEQKAYAIDEVISILEREGFQLAYSPNRLPHGEVFLRKNMSLIALLDALNQQAAIDWDFSDTLLVLKYASRHDKNHSVRGYVRDAVSGEVLIGAAISRKNLREGVATNDYGFYSYTLAPSMYILELSHLGYEPSIDTINLSRHSHIRNYTLQPKENRLAEVIISSKKPHYNITGPIPGTSTINLTNKGEIPYFLGEVDVFQSAILQPGISVLGEDANGINVRGGRNDQNLLLLDEATIYNPNHLNGLIAVFNPEVVNNIEVMKGFIPASYGGRASSVINVQQKNGDNMDYHFTGGVGLVSARLIAEGPIKKEKSSFIISGRQSLLNRYLDNNIRTSFQDLNVKVNWKYDRKSSLTLSAYYGNDRSKDQFETTSRWGNRNYALSWNHLIGKRTFTNLTAFISEYKYKITQPREAASFIGTSKVIDYSIKSDWGVVFNPKNELQFGMQSTVHRLRPGDRLPFDETSSSSNPLFLDPEFGWENALYASHEFKPYPWVSLIYGLRYSSLHDFGPGEVYNYDQDLPRSDQSILDTTRFAQFDLIKSYHNLEPRVASMLKIAPSMSVKASYTTSNQYIHLISPTVTPNPTDIWKLSNTYIPPTRAHHSSLGLYSNFLNNKIETYLEGYYKRLQNTVEFKNGANLLFNSNPETEILSGIGRAYGLEVFVRKTNGSFTGWLSYTLSWTESKVLSDFPEETINNGNYFFSDDDRRHDLSLVGIYKVFPRLSASFSFNFNSGRPFTLPIGKYEYNDFNVPIYGTRNAERLPHYHRLDLSIKWHGKSHHQNGSVKRYTDFWTLVVYNVYGRNNVYAYNYQLDEQNDQFIIAPYAIFDSAIPAITYHFRF